MSERVEQRAVLRVGGHGPRRERDPVVVEAPLELRVRGQAQVVIMRTPGHDRELAAGLLLSEGAIAGRAELGGLRVPEGLPPEDAGNVLEIGDVRMPERSMLSTASCGVCGKRAIADLEVRARPIRSDLTATAEHILRLPERLRAAQEVFAETGGLHAAAAFGDDGELHAVREDVGRHNAVDKLVGWALASGRLPLDRTIMCVSGRLGYEIVQKAAVAGVPIVAAVSAPSSLAIDVAERFRVTLCGFVRQGRFNVYSHPYRVA